MVYGPEPSASNYRELSEWNGTYSTQKAMTVGPNTVEVIQRILASRKLEVQTHRMCQDVLSFTMRYSKQALELGNQTYANISFFWRRTIILSFFLLLSPLVLLSLCHA